MVNGAALPSACSGTACRAPTVGTVEDAAIQTQTSACRYYFDSLLGGGKFAGGFDNLAREIIRDV